MQKLTSRFTWNKAYGSSVPFIVWSPSWFGFDQTVDWKQLYKEEKFKWK